MHLPAEILNTFLADSASAPILALFTTHTLFSWLMAVKLSLADPVVEKKQRWRLRNRTTRQISSRTGLKKTQYPDIISYQILKSATQWGLLCATIINKQALAFSWIFRHRFWSTLQAYVTDFKRGEFSFGEFLSSWIQSNRHPWELTLMFFCLQKFFRWTKITQSIKRSI